MKTIGILGGMSWESSLHYYAQINRGVRDALGHPHSARIVMLSVDFAEIQRLQFLGEWNRLGAMLAEEARRLAAAGADCVLIATNTMHCVAETVQAAVGVPLIHIADATGAAVRDAGVTRVALLGTAFTMEQPFYRDRLAERFGLDVLVPDAAARGDIHRIIYEELTAGIVRDESRAIYRAAIDALVAQGAQGVILGCTEIMMLIGPQDVAVPVFDTTALHAAAAVAFALDR